DVGRAAKALERCVADIERAELGVDRGEVRRPGGRARLDEDAAAEVDAEIEPDAKEEPDREQGQQDRDGEPDLMKPHEVDAGRPADDDEGAKHRRLRAGRAWGGSAGPRS